MGDIHSQARSNGTHSAQASLPACPDFRRDPLRREKLFERLLRNKSDECYHKGGATCHVALLRPGTRYHDCAPLPEKAYYELRYYGPDHLMTQLYFDASGRALAYDTQDLRVDKKTGHRSATGAMIRVSNPDKVEKFYSTKIHPMMDPRFVAQLNKKDIAYLKKTFPIGSTRKVTREDIVISERFSGTVTHTKTGMMIFNLMTTTMDVSPPPPPSFIHIVLNKDGNIKSAVEDKQTPIGPNAQKVSNGVASSTILSLLNPWRP